VTFTVIECVTLPEVPVIVTGYVPAAVGGALEHPAATIRSAAAPASPSRARNRRTTGKVNSNSSAKAARATCCIEIGGLLVDVGRVTKACVVTVTFPIPGAVTALDGAMQLPCGIVAEQESVTAPVKPPSPPTVTAIVAVEPGVTVTGCALRLKSQAVPAKVTVWGLPVTLSEMLRTAAWLPLAPAAGVKVTLITHVAFAARAAPLVHVVPVAMAKSAALAPEIDGAALIFRLEPPVFFKVTV